MLGQFTNERKVNMREISKEIKEEIRKLVYEFFAEECDVEVEEITEETSILDDLDGDSLMFLELVELLKKKYDLSIQLQTIGKYLLKNPAETIREVIETSYLIYEKEDELVDC